MDEIVIAKLRPAAWKVYVQGKDQARHVQRALRETNMQTSEIEEEPDLLHPSVYSLTTSPGEECPLTQEELVAVLESDRRVQVSLPPHESEA
jgi:hypothetical protein